MGTLESQIVSHFLHCGELAISGNSTALGHQVLYGPGDLNMFECRSSFWPQCDHLGFMLDVDPVNYGYWRPLVTFERNDSICFAVRTQC